MNPRRSHLAMTLLVLALAGCTSAPVAPSAEPTGPAGSCPEVTVVVDFGVLDGAGIEECAPAGPAAEALADAGVATEGTVEYGDQVVCRVNGRPGPDETISIEGQEPFTEPCASMPVATAYWALWLKPAPDAAWEYAQEGIASLDLEAGQSLGLVYTAGDDSAPPAG